MQKVQAAAQSPEGKAAAFRSYESFVRFLLLEKAEKFLADKLKQ
jgi:hypothetical protein